MDCKFCKLEKIDLLEDGSTFKCSYCGYSFDVGKTAIFYDKMMQMPLSSWLLAAILWFSAMVTGVLLGLGFSSTSLTSTILFLFIYGASALMYGISASLDFFSVVGKYIKGWFSKEKVTFGEAKLEVQAKRKEKIVREMATGQALDEATGKAVDTDIRPGEKRIAKLAPSFLAGSYTIILAALFIIVFSNFFPPI
ncbi:MAG: hypothetical protein H7647_12080 [Candidatus Heimdallarchaeota archaeon]|jgi:predicted metalloprotease with PDZ domain|nr:hypothetical protein [Candidatus Heimdallarchaeota archaeon]MCK4255164.1 hypothetical protein [Candidatus Heimdallarchaeota archaeon]